MRQSLTLQGKITKQQFYKYKWLKVTTTVEDYIEPSYYDNLLKPYIFSGKTDLEIFSDFLMKKFKKQNNKINALELGCGNGRATQIFLNKIKPRNIELVDLSSRMITITKKNFRKNNNIRYITSDSIDYLNKTSNMYNFVFSLWSYSHSVHQILSKFGIKRGTHIVESALEKFIKENMEKGSYFFLIHFDSLSDEQKILIKQWKKVFPIFKNNTKQSPSKLLTDKVLEKLHNKGVINLTVKHLIGEPIIYNSLDEVLEIFMNFHMESYFNKSPLSEDIINDLSNYVQKFKNKKGEFFIKPGCFIYTFKKNI